MTEADETTKTLKTILVALDHSNYSRAALELAATLAELFEADIHGLFVQDEQWQRLAKLTTLSQIDELTGRITPVGRGDVEKDIRSIERSIQNTFELISRRHRLKHKWRSVHGKVAEKVLEASRDTDIITIGSRGRSFLKTQTIGSTALSIIQQAKKPVLILRDKYHPVRSPVVIFDGSEKSESGLYVASGIAAESGTGLIVIAIPGKENNSRHNTSKIHKFISPDVHTSLITLKEPDLGQLLFLLNKHAGRLVVLPKQPRFTKRHVIEHILESVQSPLLMAT